MVDLKGTIERLKNQNVTLRYPRYLDEDSLQIPKWRFLHERYKSCSEDTSEKVIISLWNAILNQERVVFVITREHTRQLISRDKNWELHGGGTGFKNSNWNFILRVAIQSNLIRLVQEGSNRRPSVYELVDTESLKFFAETSRETQLKQALKFVENYDSEAFETGEFSPNEEVENEWGHRGGDDEHARSGDDEHAYFGNRKGDRKGDVEVRSKKVEVSKKQTSVSSLVDVQETGPRSDSSDVQTLDGSKVQAMVRNDVRETILEDKKTYPRRLVTVIEQLVGAYGEMVDMMDVREGINRALSQVARKRAYEIAQEAFDSAQDARLTAGLKRPAQVPRSDRCMSAEEKDEAIYQEYKKRFRNITEEILAEVAEEEANVTPLQSAEARDV